MDCFECVGRFFGSRFITFSFVALFGIGLGSSVTNAESFSVREPLQDLRSFQVTVSVQAKGTLKTPSAKKEPLDLPLSLQALIKYRERKLPPAGRDDRAWRSFRIYDQAGSKVVVKDQTTTLQLSPQARQLIAEGKRTGLILYNKSTPPRRSDIDLLTIPGDPLCLLATLPTQDVEIGDTWAIPGWAAQMFAGLEAATTSKLTGKLLAVTDHQATLQITGEVSGATTGAEAKVILNGTATFDLNEKILTSFKLIQQEKRSISTVSPGMDVTATIQWNRNKLSKEKGIPDSFLAGVPLDLPPISHLLQFQSKYWNVQLTHDRRWHLFQEIPTVTVLRFVDSGSLISQCNIAKIGAAQPGNHVSPEQFEKDIRTSLGEQFKEIIEATEIPSGNKNYIYRVIVAGNNSEMEMVWIYYLCANPEGKQMSFVFAAEHENLKVLSDQDLAIIKSLTFLSEKK